MADVAQSQAALFGDSPPIFDMQEFPPLRRVKPLPKRRRMIDPQVESATNVAPLSSEPSPDELAAALPSSMALQSHYLPIFGGAQDMFKDDIDARHVDPSDFVPRAADEGFSDGRDNADQGDGDYMDHLQQPGNTKKRKVPVTAHSRPGDRDDELDNFLGDNELMGRVFLPERGVAEATESVSLAPLTGKKGRLSRATNAGLQHKEMLKARKRQLAAVLGALSHGDSLALDQALSTHSPFSKSARHQIGLSFEGLPIRLSRRHPRRKARTLALRQKSLSKNVHDENTKLLECIFSFECDNATSERLRATKEEVAQLHSRFEVELSRQAAKAAEAARQAAMVVNQMHKSKRDERSQQRARITGNLSTGANGDAVALNSDKAIANSKGKTKKKKRSALANASNPHHLRNYVPSRLPHSGPLHSGQAAINAQNNIGPLPLRFLSSELPPRRKKTNYATPSLTNLTNPEDEWICAFCEYELFYGDEHSFRRSVRQRKKILSRRRRAMERAAAAAAGRKKGDLTSPDRSDSVSDDLADAFDVTSPEVQATSKHIEAGREQERDRDKDRDRDKGKGPHQH